MIADNVHSKVFLPIDSDLQANVQKWIGSDKPDLRLVGSRGMLYFKSDANAEILKSLLDDPAVWGRRDALNLLDHLAYPFDPRYLIRWEAWHTLMGWGYEATERPKFR